MRQKGDDEDEFEMRSGASNKPDGSSGAGSCRASSFVSRLGCRSEIFLGVLWEQNQSRELKIYLPISIKF